MQAVLFAGQGSQCVGMGVPLTARCSSCRDLFSAADRALNFPLSAVMAEGPEEKLKRTEIAQPAIVTHGVAEAFHLMEAGLEPTWLAGHSVGQYAALTVAGIISFEAALRLVAARGRLIQEAVPLGSGAMYAIAALEREAVYRACREHRHLGCVDVACHNGPRITVISGTASAVKAVAERCADLGAATIPLTVSAAFHCRLLGPVVPRFAAVLDRVELAQPRLPVIDNVTAAPLADAASVRSSLLAHLTAPVLFAESLDWLFSQGGVRRVIQCGPGGTLLRLAKTVCPAAVCVQASDLILGEHSDAARCA